MKISMKKEEKEETEETEEKEKKEETEETEKERQKQAKVRPARVQPHSHHGLLIAAGARLQAADLQAKRALAGRCRVAWPSVSVAFA